MTDEQAKPTPDTPPIIIIISGTSRSFATIADAVAYLHSIPAA